MSERYTWQTFVGAVFWSVVSFIPGDAAADISLSLEPGTHTYVAGSANTGFFDVYLTSSALSDDPDTISGYFVEIDLTGPSTGVAFPTSGYVTDDTGAPDGPVFGAETDLRVFDSIGTSLSYDDFPTDELAESLSTGSTFGAGRIFFEVSADAAPGEYTVTFDSAATGYLDGAGQQAVFANLAPATITILPAAVPEPSATLLLGLSGVMGLAATGLRRRRSRRTAPTPPTIS